MNLESSLIVSFLILSVIGTLLHFTHNWLKNGLLLHIFSAVNESTWEHMKLLVLPTLLVIIFQYFSFQNISPNFFNSILVLYMVEIISIPLVYEVLRVIFKEVHFLITILIFYISISLGIYSQYLILNNEISFINENIAICLILVITIMFGIFTYFPPRVFLFKDPITGKYGDIN